MRLKFGSLLVVALALAFAAAQPANAQLTWDGTGSGGTGDGAGVWNTASKWWNGSTDTIWVSGSAAVFGNGGPGGAVTLTVPTTVDSLTMNSFTGTYTLGTGTQLITLNSGITMNSGAGATTIISPITMGAAQSWTNNDDSLLTIGTGAVTNAGFLLTIGGTGNTTVTSAIGGTGGLTKTGAGLLTLSGSNTFTGQLTVASGTLSIASINNVNANGTLGNSDINRPVILGSVGNTGTLRYTAATGSSNKAFTLAAGGTGAFDITTALTISDTIDGSGNLIKLGAGELTLGQTSDNYGKGRVNQFTGITTITAGRIKLIETHGSAANNTSFGLQYSVWDTTGSTGAIGLNITGLNAGGGVSTVWLGGLAGSVNLATAITDYGTLGTLVLNPQTGTSTSYGGVIANGAAGMTLTKNGQGTQTLTNTNTYSGATTINAGTLALSGASGSATSSAFTVRGGAVELDNSGGTFISRLGDATALSLGSLTLKSYNGAGNQTETVGATTFATGGKVTINNGSTGGDQTTLAMGAVTRSAGAAIDFVGTNGTLGSGANSPNVTSTGAFPGTVNGILPWATVGGTQWAEDNANSIRAYSGSFFALASATNSQNAQLTGNLTLGGAAVGNSLNLITSGAGESLSLGANNLTLGSAAGSAAAILKSGADAYTISGTGQVRAGSAGAGTELIAHVDGGALTISAPLATAILGIAKGGSGDLILSGTRAGTLSGTIGIGGGNLEFQGSTTIITGLISGPGGLITNLNAGQLLNIKNTGNTFSGPILIKGGMLADGDAYNTQGVPGGVGSYNGLGNIEITNGTLGVPYHFGRYLGTGASQIQITGGTSGFTAYGGAPTFTINGSAAYEVVWGSPYFQPATLVLNDVQANAAFNFQNRLDLNGSTRTVAVNSTTQAATISGAIRTSSGTAGLTKIGAGTLILSGANTYNGNTSVDQGTLTATVAAALSGYNSAGRVVFNGGTVGVQVGGAGWTTGQVDTLLGNATKTSGALGIDTTNGSLTQWTAFTTTNLGSTLGLAKLGVNTLTLNQANTYAGVTTVADGILIATHGDALGSGDLNIAATKSFLYFPSTPGALNIGGTYTLGSATALNTALSGTASQSVIAVTGAASLTGTGVVNIFGIPGAAPAAGTHNLITAASGLTGGTYTFGKVFNNTDFTVSNFTRSATAISVDVASATALNGNVYWKGGLTGSTGVWSASNGSTQSNWQVTDGVNQPLAPGAAADLVFSTATSPGTMVGMTLGANMAVRSITINNTATAFGLSDPSGFALTITPSSSATGITIGAGVQAATISAPVILGANQTWTNNSGNAFTASGGLNTNGNQLIVDGSGPTNITGVISGSGGITKNGSGKLSFNTGNANTYTGDTIINGGVLMMANNTASLGSGNLLLNGGVLEQYWGLTFNRSLGSGAGQVQLVGGASGFSQNGNNTDITLNNNNAIPVVWGSTYFQPSSLVLMANTAQTNATLNFQNSLDLNGATRTVEVAKTTSVTSGATMSGVISNSSSTASGLTKTGPGILILSAANTFNGVTTISDGVLSLTNASALQNSVLDTTNSVAGSATVGLKTTQTTLTLGGLIGSKAFDDTAGSVFTTASGGYSAVTAVTLNVAATGNLSYSGAIGNGAASTSLTKSGLGTQNLSGVNSYTGATVVNAGTLLLDMTGSGALASTAALTLGGGSFEIKGGATSSQTLGALTLNAGDSTILLDPNNGTSTDLILGNAWTRNAGSSLLIDYSSSNTGTRQVLTAGTTTGYVLSNGIYGGILVKDSAGVTGFATRAAGASQPITRYDDTTGTTLVDNSNVAGTNFTTLNTVYTSGTLNWNNVITTRSVNSLTIDTTNNGGTINMGVSGNILTLTSLGILFKGSNNSILTGGQVGGAASEVIIHQTGAGSLTINSLISSGAGSLTMDGTGTVILGGNNTYTGTTRVNGGTLSIDANVRLGAQATGATLNLSGGTLQATATFGLYNGTPGTNNRAVSLVSGQNGFDVTGSNILTVAGVISGAGSFSKTNTGTLTVTGANTYTGGAAVVGGTLLVNNTTGSGTGTGNLAVELNAVLGGTGSISGNVTFDGGSFLRVVDFGDALATTGTVTFGSGFGIDNIDLTATGFTWDTLDLDTPYTVLASSQDFSTSGISNFGSSNKVSVGSIGREAYFQNGSLQFVIVPEPTTLAILGACVAIAAFRFRKRLRAA